MSSHAVDIVVRAKSSSWCSVKAISRMLSSCVPGGSLSLSSDGGLYGSDVRERAYWGGGDYSAWIDFSNSLLPGVLQRFYVFAQPSADTNNIGTAVSRIQIWRQSPSTPAGRAFQLVWQRRVLMLPCNSTVGALHAVCTSHHSTGWLRGPAVERLSLADVLSLSCARPVADG